MVILGWQLYHIWKVLWSRNGGHFVRNSLLRMKCGNPLLAFTVWRHMKGCVLLIRIIPAVGCLYKDTEEGRSPCSLPALTVLAHRFLHCHWSLLLQDSSPCWRSAEIPALWTEQLLDSWTFSSQPVMVGFWQIIHVCVFYVHICIYVLHIYSFCKFCLFVVVWLTHHRRVSLQPSCGEDILKRT